MNVPEPVPQASAGQQVFISYGRADALDFAQRLRGDLEASGHHAWLDLTAIEQGALFEVRIEQGIRAATVVAAVMTPHSVREESVCRDEIVFALNEGKNVVPLRAHPEVRPTLLLARRNWIDFTRDYARALAALLRFLGGDDSALAPPALPSVTGVAPLDFGPEIARYSAGFTGRAWLGEAIDAWLADDRLGALVLVGEPGVGKSAVAAWLCLTRPEVVGIHFCTHRSSRSLDPHELVASLVAQLHARVPGYAERVDRRRPEVRRPRAADAFRELLVEPGRELDPGRRLVVVDSLDEAAAREGETIADVLAEQAPDLPPWLRIVATTRPESSVLDRIRALRTLSLAPDSRDNLQDLRDYCRSRLRDGHAEALAARIEGLAQGNFLYARMALDALESGALEPDDLGTLSPGLADFFAFAFRRRFLAAEAFRRECMPLLTALVAARGPLTGVRLARASGQEVEQVRRLLRELRTYLRPSREGDEPAWSLFHASLRDWLADAEAAGEYWCSEPRGHERLADALAEQWPSDGYALRHLPAHLLAARRRTALVALLTRLDFVERKCAAGMTYDLVSDYQAALAAQTDPEPELLDFARFVQRRAHVLATQPRRARVEAALEPEGSAPSRVARASSGPAGAWIDWTNRPRAQDACVMTLHAHSAAVTACAFAPDGQRLLTASEDGTLRVWDARTGAARVELRSHGPVLSAAWVGDGGRIVSTAADGTLRVWDGDHGRWVGGWAAHQREATACAVSPDGHHVVTGAKDRTLRVWRIDSGQLVATLTAHDHAVTCCAFSPDGRWLLSGAQHHRIGVWNTAGYRLVDGLSGHHRGVAALAFAPDSRRFVSASDDRTLVVWEMASLEPVATLSGHREAVRAVAWSPDGQRIVSGSADRTLRVWDPSGAPLAALAGHTDELTAVAVSPDGHWIASAARDGTVRLWDAAAAARSEPESRHAGAIDACALSPDGSRLLTASRDRSLGIWDTVSGRLLARLEGHEEAVLGCAWSPDGARLVSASLDNTLRLWDATTLAEQAVLARILGQGLAGDSVGITCCAFSPDGRRALGGSGDGFLGVREVASGRLLARFSGHASGVLGCAFSPDGGGVASASWDGTVRLWDAATGAERHVLSGHGSGVRACSFSPDGRRLASAADDGTLRLWDTADGQALGVVATLDAGLRSCAFLADGRHLAIAADDGSVRVVDAQAREEVAAFLGEAPVHAVATGPAGLLAAGDALGRPLLLRLVGVGGG